MDSRRSRRCGMCVTARIARLWESCLQTCGKRLVFFHQVVNGFSISTSGSFPYFHDARKSSNDQPVHRQRHIPYRHNQPPCQNETTDHTTDNKVQCKQGDPSTQEPPPGTIQRHIRWRPNGSPQSIQSHT